MTRILQAFTTPFSQMTIIDSLIIIGVLYVAAIPVCKLLEYNEKNKKK